jgi:hypothetical protein
MSIIKSKQASLKLFGLHLLMASIVWPMLTYDEYSAAMGVVPRRASNCLHSFFTNHLKGRRTIAASSSSYISNSSRMVGVIAPSKLLLYKRYMSPRFSFLHALFCLPFVCAGTR